MALTSLEGGRVRICLLDLLILQLDRLLVDEDALPLIRFRHPPFPYMRRELHDGMSVHPLQQYPRRLGCACLDALWYSQLDGMRVSDFEVHELLARELGLFRRCGRFDGGSVANANES